MLTAKEATRNLKGFLLCYTHNDDNAKLQQSAWKKIRGCTDEQQHQKKRRQRKE